MRDFLTDKEAAKILRKRIDSLYKIVAKFDENPNDEWELVEGEHFEFLVKSSTALNGQRPRRFTEEGVEALARYIEATEKINIFQWLGDNLLQWKRKRKQLLVSRRITQEFIDANSTVVLRGELAFVSKRMTVNILQTNHKGINNSWKRIQTDGTLEGEEAVELDKHFIEHEAGEILFSQKGIARVARDMKKNSKIRKTRRAWVEAVGSVVEDCFKSEVKYLASAPLRIEEAIKKAKRAARQCCEVTGTKQQVHNQIELDGHHLFDRRNRPDLADFSDNILVVLPEIHSEFHSWKGNSGCCPRDFISFISEVRSDLFDPVNSKAMERHRKLIKRLTLLQANYEDNRLRYH
jgi:hypothetical protein